MTGAQTQDGSQPTINQTLGLLDLLETILADSESSANVPKSTLLAIARETDEERQETLWKRAKSDGLMVRKTKKRARQESPREKPKAVFKTSHGASVIVQSDSKVLTSPQVALALEEALAHAFRNKEE